MISVRTAHTAQLDPGTLAEARALLYAVFDDMTERTGSTPWAASTRSPTRAASWSATRR